MNSSTSKSNIPGNLIAIVIVLSCLLLFLMFQFIGVVPSKWFSSIKQVFLPTTQTPVEIRNIIVGGLEEMNELTTIQMSTKATVDIKEERKFLGDRVPLGDTHVVYEAVGTVQAGIDLDRLNVEKINVENHNQVRLILPPPRITDAFLDVNESRVVVHFRRGFGRSVESELQERAQKDALALIKKEVCANNILDKANQHAKTLIENILHSAGYEEVIVDTQPPGINACRV